MWAAPLGTDTVTRVTNVDEQQLVPNPAEPTSGGGDEGRASRSPDNIALPARFEKGGAGWTIGAAVVSIALMLALTWILASNGVYQSDTFIKVLAFVSVSVAGLGSILRAMAHGAATVKERRVDHGGKLLAVVALSSAFTGALASLDLNEGALGAGFWIAVGIGGVLLLIGIPLHLKERKKKNSPA